MKIENLVGAGRPAWCRRVQVPELAGSTPASARRKTMHISILEVKMKGKKCWKCKYWTKYFDSNRYFCKRGYCKN